jgi:hypothetical protein
MNAVRLTDAELKAARAALEVAATPIYDSLVAERGGDGVLSVAHKAILKKLSRLLASPSADPRVADAISRLTALVPPALPMPVAPLPDLAKIEAGDLPWDLGRLDDAALDQLEVLASIATGTALPIKDARRTAALDLAALLNRAEREGKLFDIENEGELRTGVLNAFHDLLRPLVPYSFFGCADIDLRMADLERQNAAVAAEPPVRPPEDGCEVLQPRPNNVVPLRDDGTIAMAAGYQAALGGASGYLPPDKVDANGRRLDDDGKPQSRRQ